MHTELYHFVAGHGDAQQLHEINAMAHRGYRVVNMVYDEPEKGNNKEVLVLMELREPETDTLGIPSAPTH